jgi:hypothetical protein
MPPAFALSQDQTLRFIFASIPDAKPAISALTNRPELMVLPFPPMVNEKNSQSVL